MLSTGYFCQHTEWTNTVSLRYSPNTSAEHRIIVLTNYCFLNNNISPFRSGDLGEKYCLLFRVFEQKYTFTKYDFRIFFLVFNSLFNFVNSAAVTLGEFETPCVCLPFIPYFLLVRIIAVRNWTEMDAKNTLLSQCINRQHNNEWWMVLYMYNTIAAASQFGTIDMARKYFPIPV